MMHGTMNVKKKPSGYFRYHQVSRSVNISSAHRLQLCLVCFSEQRVIIFSNRADLLVFITDTECVYCEIRTESL